MTILTSEIYQVLCSGLMADFNSKPNVSRLINISFSSYDMATAVEHHVLVLSGTMRDRNYSVPHILRT